MISATAAVLLTFAAATEPPAFEWRQLLSPLRPEGRLRSIAVDPVDPNRLYVGTDEGTIMRSTDGGITWRDIEFRPFSISEEHVSIQVPGLPRLGETTPNNFKVFVDTPDLQSTDRIPIPSVADPFPVRPEFFFAGFLATSPNPPVTLFADSLAFRTKETRPAWRIVVCRGGRYELLVVTSRDLWGSTDDGLTFVRLFANPGRAYINNVECNPSNPDQLAVATSIGLFTSLDGGLTFDQDLTAWPGQPSTAVAFGPGPAGQEGTRLYSAAGSELFAGEMDEGLDVIYPNDPSTAPWLPIRWIATNQEGIVWLATDDGARVSPDAGQSWVTAARALLSRQEIAQVEIGQNEKGQDRVAVLLNTIPRNFQGRAVSGVQDSMVYSSDDGGRTWHPFFHALSRNAFRQMTALPRTAKRPGGWWVVASDGVWTTFPRWEPAGSLNERARRWARNRIRTTPGLDVTLDEILDVNGLSNARIERLNDLHRYLNLVPRLDMLFELGTGRLARREGQALVGGPGFTQDIGRDHADVDYVFFIQALWDLYDTIQIREKIAPTRNNLYWLQWRYIYTAERLWHERMELLRLLADGMSDKLQIEILKARIESIEAVLDVWLRRNIHPERTES